MVTGLYLYLTVPAIFDPWERFTSQVYIHPTKYTPAHTDSKNIVSLSKSQQTRYVATIKKMMWTFPMITLNRHVEGAGHLPSFSLSFK